MIIGLTGKKQSGKDTTFLIIKQLRPHAERRAFADALKMSASQLLNVSIKELDEWKLEKYPVISLVFDTDEVRPLMGVREFLQRYGTEAHRDVFGENFWLDQCLPLDEEKWLRDPENLVIVTDVRFDNEAEWIKDLGGLIFRIERDTVDTKDSHASETPISPHLVDQVVQNNGTLDELTEKIKENFKLYGIRIRCGC